jgi:hypothetical protein
MRLAFTRPGADYVAPGKKKKKMLSRVDWIFDWIMDFSTEFCDQQFLLPDPTVLPRL